MLVFSTGQIGDINQFYSSYIVNLLHFTMTPPAQKHGDDNRQKSHKCIYGMV